MEQQKKASDKQPHVMDMKAGKYAWCSCRLSENQPFCDGAHKGTGLTPVVVNLEEDKKVAWCGCKATGTPPFCDGSHSK